MFRLITTCTYMPGMRFSITPEIHFRLRIDDSTNLPNDKLSDILQATHIYAFSTSGFFVFICIDIS